VGVKIVVIEGEDIDRNQPIRPEDRIPTARYPVPAKTKPNGPGLEEPDYHGS
jgi:hypothetical protein